MFNIGQKHDTGKKNTFAKCLNFLDRAFKKAKIPSIYLSNGSLDIGGKIWLIQVVMLINNFVAARGWDMVGI